MIVNELARGAILQRDTNAPSFEIHFAHPPAHQFRATQAGAQRRADVARLQAAAGHFSQHRREQQGVGLAHQRERDGTVRAEDLLEILSGGHPRESAAQNDDVLRLRRGGLARSGSGPSFAKARSFRACAINPRAPPYSTQPISSGNRSRMPWFDHSGVSPRKQREQDHAEDHPGGYAQRRRGHGAVGISARSGAEGDRIHDAHQNGQQDSSEHILLSKGQRKSRRQSGDGADRLRV